jgi:hypothetical protein
MNLFIRSRPKLHPPTQKTSTPTQICHPIHVPKKKPPNPPCLHMPLPALPPRPTSLLTSGRMLLAGSNSSSSSSLCTALRLLGYGEVDLLLTSISGTAGCSSCCEFLDEWLVRELSICAYCSTSEWSVSSRELFESVRRELRLSIFFESRGCCAARVKLSR